MKNSQLVTAWLDQSEETYNLHLQLLANPLAPGLFDQWEASLDTGSELWQACLNDGWTVAELDRVYERRTGRKVNRS